MINLPDQRGWYHMNTSKRFCRIQAKLGASGWNTSSVLCPLLAKKN